MIEIERTYDMELIKKIITHPRVYPYARDDQSPPPDKFHPTNHPLIIYLLTRKNGKPAGVMMGVPENGICIRAHHYFLPIIWGKAAMEAALQAINYIWNNTAYQRIVGKTPLCNVLAIRFAFKIGMECVGFDRKSVQIKGKLWDQAIFGMSRPEGV